MNRGVSERGESGGQREGKEKQNQNRGGDVGGRKRDGRRGEADQRGMSVRRTGARAGDGEHAR